MRVQLVRPPTPPATDVRPTPVPQETAVAPAEFSPPDAIDATGPRPASRIPAPARRPSPSRTGGSTIAPPTIAALASPVALNFRGVLLAHIGKFQRYPDAARPQMLHGRVVLIFNIGPDGRVLNVRIETSSGSAILDAAAMDTLRRAEPLPTIPKELPRRMEVMAPIVFSAP
jgi:protein TonB